MSSEWETEKHYVPLNKEDYLIHPITNLSQPISTQAEYISGGGDIRTVDGTFLTGVKNQMNAHLHVSSTD